MNKVIVLIGLLLLTFSLSAQTNPPGLSGLVVPTPPTEISLITNGNSVLTVSNGIVIATASVTQASPPPAFIAEVASSLGIPTWVLSVIPVKYLVWLAIAFWLLPYVGRAWHAWQADGGFKGVTAAVVFGTNVPVALKVQETGQPVVPTVPVNPGQPPKV